MVLGFIGLIRPMPKLFLPTRKRAALAVLLGFVALEIGAANDQSAPGVRQASVENRPEHTATAPEGETEKIREH
jgi:hypothetical protein